jgi:hypothetical protein
VVSVLRDHEMTPPTVRSKPLESRQLWVVEAVSETVVGGVTLVAVGGARVVVGGARVIV